MGKNHNKLIRCFFDKFLRKILQRTKGGMRVNAIKCLHPLFSSFQTHITIFTTNRCEKCTSRIWCWDWNLQPPVHASSWVSSHNHLTRAPTQNVFNVKLLVYSGRSMLYLLMHDLQVHLIKMCPPSCGPEFESRVDHRRLTF